MVGSLDFTDYINFLPPTGDTLQNQGLFGSAEATSANQLFGIKSTQLLDLLSSLGLSKEFIPKFAQQELDLAKQIIPGQLAFQTDIFGKALGGAKGALTGAGFGDLFAGQDLLSKTAMEGLQGLGGGVGSLPGAVDKQLGDFYASSLSRFGEGNVAAAGQASSAFAATKASLGEQIRQQRINQALGVQQSGLGLAGFLTGTGAGLLGQTGLPDIGTGPIGFGGAAGIYNNSTELLAAHRAGQAAKRGAWLDFAGNVLGSFGGGFGKAAGAAAFA